MGADELIARLAAEGELDSDGSFTLDPAVALDKLREYQLAEPTRFVLSWVRAATLLGATRVDIEIDADDVWFRFDGDTLTAADFDALWSSVVGARGNARVRACRELALGINGAFTWEAKTVTVHSGALRVDFDRRFEMTREQRSRGEDEPTNLIHAKRPLGWDLVHRKLLDSRGALPEEQVLAEACAHGRVPIWLEGRQLNPEPDQPLDLLLRVEIDADERRGFVLFRARASPFSSLRVLKAGVEVALIRLPYAHGFVEAVVDDPLLPLDLSQQRQVEGERWRALLDCVSRARWQGWFTLTTRDGWPRPTTGGVEAELQSALVEDIFASPDTSWIDTPGAMAFADRLVLPRAVENPLADFVALGEAERDKLALPWPRPEPGELTLGELVGCARARGVLFVSAKSQPELPFVPELPVLLRAPSVGMRALGALVLDRPQIIARYRAAVAELRELSRGRTLPQPWRSLEHRHDQLKVRLAWECGSRRRPGALVLGREDRALAHYQLPSSWGPLWVEVEGPFELEPAARFEIQLASAVLAALERYHDLLAGLDGHALSPDELDIVHGYLRDAQGRWSAQRLLELGHIGHEAGHDAIASWRRDQGGWGVPADWVSPPHSERASCDHPLMELAWLERNGERVSLRDIQGELAIHSPLPWLDRQDPSEAPADVWRLDTRERTIIADVFHAALAPFDRHAWRRRWRAPGELQVPTSLGGARVSVVLQGEAGERGILALPEADVPEAWSRPPRCNARLLLLRDGHDLGWMDVKTPVGPFYGVIEVPRAAAAPYTDRALKNQAWEAAAAVVTRGARALAQAQLDAWIAGQHADDRARVRDWSIDLERSSWTSIAAALQAWQAQLPPDHPLHVLEHSTLRERP